MAAFWQEMRVAYRGRVSGISNNVSAAGSQSTSVSTWIGDYARRVGAL